MASTEQKNVESEFLTSEELAEMLKVSLKFVAKNSYRIPGRTKIGHLVRYQTSAIKRAIAGGNLLIKD